ncbi:MAG: NusG domain II-containing protein [Clostridia bacterium]
MKIKGIKLLMGDIIIVALIIIMAILIFVLMLPKTYTNNILEVYLDGELIDSISLEEDNYQTIEINETASVTIEIDGLEVRVINSTCYDHVCENTGYISVAGEVIVCMPNKLLLKIVGDETEIEYDVVVG